MLNIVYSLHVDVSSLYRTINHLHLHMANLRQSSKYKEIGQTQGRQEIIKERTGNVRLESDVNSLDKCF